MNIIRVLNRGNLLRTAKFYSTKAEKTALFDFHVQNGGKMVDFGGYMLPVQYSDLSITASHLHTRKNASLFDVSHMLQTEIKGVNCLSMMESICTADLQNLPQNSSVLTVFTNPSGGILDDLIITKLSSDHLYIVSNAAMKVQDQKIMSDASRNFSGISIKFFTPTERSLVALQGPKSAEILQTNLKGPNLKELYFMQSAEASICEVGGCRVTRCGYTGEDGFELSVPSIKIADVVNELLKNEQLKLAGLGARDSLRLEAGLCLYGSDIDGTTTPVQAGLTWLVAKARRDAGSKPFPGKEQILREIKEGSKRKRVGLMGEGPPARHGNEIMVKNGVVGEITSGCPSPSLAGRNVAMGYVPTELSKSGTEVSVKIRNKTVPMTVAKMPFVKANYYNKPKA